MLVFFTYFISKFNYIQKKNIMSIMWYNCGDSTYKTGGFQMEICIVFH